MYLSGVIFWLRRRSKSRQRFNSVAGVIILLTLAFCLAAQSDVSDKSKLLNTINTCGEFVSSFGRRVENSSTVPDEIAGLLSLVDHIFVLSSHDCTIKLPLHLRSRSDCVKGKVLDGCIPKEFIRGSYEHAMKVTFSHAIILHISRVAGYKHIAVLEDDVSFVERQLSPKIAGDFRSLLQTNSWNLIRLGFRPYFLQKLGTVPCPTNCRCKLSLKFGEHLCEMVHAGCDIRSSDFFILHMRQFALLEDRLVDLKLENSKRIIDVHPMRSIDKQWLFLPQVSYQETLDIPVDYQLGAGAIYVKKCAGPRPLPLRTSQQLQLTALRERTASSAPPNQFPSVN
jgi:hypothetical protein